MEGEKAKFIKVDKFDSVISAITVIKKKLSEAKVNLVKINQLKDAEDLAVQKWGAELDNVENKIENIELELMGEGR